MLRGVSEISTLFYTAANRGYWHFAPLYIYFLLHTVPDAIVEVALEDAQDFEEKNSGAISVLRELYGDRFKISNVEFGSTIPGLVRFVTQPTFGLDRDFVYIGDIDILILVPAIEAGHVKNMSANNLPFSNVLRKLRESDAGRRLSGLHFAPMDLQYPLPDISDIDVSVENALQGADEHILYQIMLRKGVMVPETANYRPEFGIHISNGRHPFGKRRDGRKLKFDFEEIRLKNQSVAWSNIHKPEIRDAYRRATDQPGFKKLFFNLDIKARNLIMILENLVEERFDDFYQEMRRYVTRIE